MRPLDEDETKAVFEKLFKFTGNNLKNIVENPSYEGPDSNPSRYCFRINKNKVYYVSESLVKRATNVARNNLVSLGSCIGKYTHGGSFHLTVQSLSLLAANAKHKVWLKPTSEMAFLYGNHVLKDTDGFVIPSLEIGDLDRSKTDVIEVEASKPPSPKAKKEENIYLGPHGAPPSQSKQQEPNSAGRKQRFKQKLKEADERTSGTGRENKLESLRELVGGGKATGNMAKGSTRDWLDPHCHESQFVKWNPQ